MCIRRARKIDPPLENVRGYKVALALDNGSFRMPYSKVEMGPGRVYSSGRCDDSDLAHWDDSSMEPGFHFYLNPLDAEYAVRGWMKTPSSADDAHIGAAVTECDMSGVYAIGVDGSDTMHPGEDYPKVGLAHLCTVIGVVKRFKED